MILETERSAFETRVFAGAHAREARALTASLAAGGGPHHLRALAALWLHAAVGGPERLAAIYDHAAEGWSGEPIVGPPIELTPGPLAMIPPPFWEAFWAGLEDGSRDDLATLLSPRLTPRIARAALAYPGVRDVAARGYPARFRLDELATCPRGSLGSDFRVLVMTERRDLEVIDHEALTSRRPPPLPYLDARIRQARDLWRLLAGYEATQLHEAALFAFQAAQFGCHAASLRLAQILTKAALTHPAGANVLLDTLLAAWRHGRESPPLMLVDWPAVWDAPVEIVRHEVGIAAFPSPWPADLFERLEPA